MLDIDLAKNWDTSSNRMESKESKRGVCSIRELNPHFSYRNSISNLENKLY